MATDADALPRIDKCYGEKCAALLWQIQQQNESAQDQQQFPAAAARKSILAVKHSITAPKSAGYRGSAASASAGINGSNALSAMKQQRPSSTRAVVKKSGGSLLLEHQASQSPRARFSSSRAFGSSGDDDHSQQQQQLEAANSDPIQAFSSPRSYGDRNRYVESNLTELDVARGENENLRLEIAVLHAKLIEKMRGGSKIVAGGQFRGKTMATGTKNAQSPAPPANCSMCATLRLDLKRRRDEFTRNQRITEELHREIEKLEAIQHTLWAENSSQSQEMRDLLEQVDEFQQAQGTQDDRIRELEQQILLKQAQENENNSEAACMRSLMTHTATQYSPLQSPHEQPNDEFAQENVALEGEVARLKVQLATNELELRNITRHWHEAQVKLGQEKSAHDTYCLKQRDREEGHRQQLGQLEQTLATAQREMAALRDCKATDARYVEQLSGTNARLLAQLQQHHDTVSQLEEANRTLQSSSQNFRVQIDEFKAQASSHSSESAHIASQLREVHAANLQLELSHTRLQTELQGCILQLAEQYQQVQELHAQIADLKQDSEQWKKQTEALEAEGGERSTQLQELLNSSEAEQQQLQSQVSALEWESARNEEFVLKLKNSHALALEQVLQSTIRLCVVAPTVNVHLSETPRSGSSTVVSSSSLLKNGPVVVCKPAPPRDRIRDIVESEILPHFTRLIVQEESTDEEDKLGTGSGDDVSSSIEPWVRDLLQAMQKKITEQLQSVYQTA